MKHAANVTDADKAAYNLILWGTAGAEPHGVHASVTSDISNEGMLLLLCACVTATNSLISTVEAVSSSFPDLFASVTSENGLPFSEADHIAVGCYPSPFASRSAPKYILLNSGFTFREGLLKTLSSSLPKFRDVPRCSF